MSSGAAVFGSPLSDGYAGAKAAIRFITAHAAEEALRAGSAGTLPTLRRQPIKPPARTFSPSPSGP
jgi:hypothetical protein